MRDRRKSHEALHCTHCGTKNRMDVIGSISDMENCQPEGQAPYEAGTIYELQQCPQCSKLVLVSGHWHEMMDEPDDWHPQVVLPEANDCAARKLLNTNRLDLHCMGLAVAEARKCVAEPAAKKPTPKVGAVVALNGTQLAFGHRGELAPGDHAEFTVLEGKCKNEVLVGATIYTTLEPCTTRNPPKIPCVERLVKRKVSRVVIGMLDPDERIRGRGVLALRRANIRVEFFPPDLMTELEEMNREFITEKERSQGTEVASTCRTPDLRPIVHLALSALSRSIPGCRSEDIGAHVWQVVPGDNDRLTRTLRVRPGSAPPNKWTPWSRGVGLVGVAWQQNNTVHLDLAEPQLQTVTSSADFERLPDDIRLGMSYDAFRVARRDFRAVWATPINNNSGEFMGVLSLNIDPNITVPFAELNAVVRPAVRDLAAALGALLVQT